MKRQQVKSSNIKAVGYNKNKKILEIEFKHGAVYCYADVPNNAAEALLDAESVGKFFSANIRNTFEFKKGEFNEENNQIQ